MEAAALARGAAARGLERLSSKIKYRSKRRERRVLAANSLRPRCSPRGSVKEYLAKRPPTGAGVENSQGEFSRHGVLSCPRSSHTSKFAHGVTRKPAHTEETRSV